MILPQLKHYNTAEYFFSPKGIDIAKNSEDYLSDAINLEFEDGCRTRKARSLALPLFENIDQIITANHRCFARFGNILREIVSAEDNTFEFSEDIVLPNGDTESNRKIVEFGETIYVFPDNIAINLGIDIEKSFGKGLSSEIKFPFIAKNGMYFTVEDDTKICYDGINLKVGDRLRFSWCPDEEFEVLKKERAETVSETECVLKGYYIWLSKEVPDLNNIPSDATAVYFEPSVKPIATDFRFGYGDMTFSFNGNKIELSTNKGGAIISDYPSDYLYEGQEVYIRNTGGTQNYGKATVTSVSKDSISFDKVFIKEKSNDDDILVISPVLPTVDFALVYSDRLWLVSNEEKRLWASAKNKPFLISKQSVGDTFSFKLTQNATALLNFKNQVLCFHDSDCTKVYGNDASNFTVTKLGISGIPSSFEKTAGIIGDSLIYCSYSGMNKFGGLFLKFIPSKIDYSKSISAIVNRDKYYILNGDRVWVYSCDSGNWSCEDGKGVKEIFNCNGKRCYLEKEGIYIAEGADYEVDFSLTTHSFFEKNKIYPMSVRFKINSKSKATLKVLISKDGGELKSLKSFYIEGEEFISATLPGAVCNEFCIKLEGTGDVQISGIYVKYRRKG